MFFDEVGMALDFKGGIKIVGLDGGVPRHFIAGYRAALFAFEYKRTGIFSAFFKADRLLQASAGVLPVAGIDINMLRAQAKRAVIAVGAA